jgi:hypothetical protein
MLMHPVRNAAFIHVRAFSGIQWPLITHTHTHVHTHTHTHTHAHKHVCKKTEQLIALAESSAMQLNPETNPEPAYAQHQLALLNRNMCGVLSKIRGA